MDFLISGAMAGMAVDTILYPLDTIKTRLQSKSGFIKSGGFSSIYKGITSAFAGSAPSAGLFFMTYDSLKQNKSLIAYTNSTTLHMISASMGEIMACLVRVPTEIIKQRMQAGHYNRTTLAILDIFKTHGIGGFYRGFLITMSREIPFTCIQFPLYEELKQIVGRYSDRPAHPYESALCGSIAGGIAAALTTPLDVIKTRIMLNKVSLLLDLNRQVIFRLIDQKSGKDVKIFSTIKSIIVDEGAMKLFSGIGPRVLWISIGGMIFFGVYEQFKLYIAGPNRK